MKKTDLKLMGIVVAGVIGAGFILNQFGDGPLEAAADGFKN